MKEYSTFPKAPPSDGLVSYTGHLLGGSYPSAEMQLAYSRAPVDWAVNVLEIILKISMFKISFFSPWSVTL